MKNSYREVTLVDYVKIVLKRKKLILSFFLFFFVLALLMNFLYLERRKVSVLLEVQDIAESPNEVSERVRLEIYGELEGITPVIKEFPNSNLLSIGTHSSSLKKAEAVLNRIGQNIIKRHGEILNEKRAVLKERIVEAEKGLSFLKTEKLYNEGIAELQLTIFDLKNQLKSLDFETKKARNNVVLRQLTFRQGLTMILLLSLVGLVFGILSAFTKEWWSRNFK